MNGKKDPGKFTVRFNIADPQQREVVETLDKQGRCKAQFLTNAVLHYIHCTIVPDVQSAPVTTSEEIERIVRNVLSQQQSPHLQFPVTEPTGSSNSDMGVDLNDTDKNTILRSIQGFQNQ